MAVTDAPPLPDTAVAVQQLNHWQIVWRRFRAHRLAMAGLAVFGLLVLLAVIGPHVAPPVIVPGPGGLFPPKDMAHADQPPTWTWPYWFGSGYGGQPEATYVLTGEGTLLLIALGGALIASMVGMVIGGLAGYLGRWVDGVLMRLVDALLSIPFLLLLVLITLYLPERSVALFVLLFGLIGWPGVARLVRGYVLNLREREYAMAARALGVTVPGIVWRHLLPNALDVLVVSFTLNVGVFMLTEVYAEFLGAGVGDSGITTGASLLLQDQWWLWAFTGARLLLTITSVNFIGDGLRDALDAGSTTRELAWKESGTSSLGRAFIAASHTLSAGWGRLQVIPHPHLPAILRDESPTERVHVPSLPLSLRLAPPVLLYLLLVGGMLYAHSPMKYAPNYSAPVSYISLLAEDSYAVEPAGAELLFLGVDPSQHLIVTRMAPTGRRLYRALLDTGDTNTQVSLAVRRARALAVWTGGDGLNAAYLTGNRVQRFRLVRGGVAEHPDAVVVPGGFDVIFTWQRAGYATHDLYLVRLRNGALHPKLVRLFHAEADASFARAVTDGQNRLDLLYMDKNHPERGGWEVRLVRLTPTGRVLTRSRSGRPWRVLGAVSYVFFDAQNHPHPYVIPPQWALGVQRLADGRVWLAWVDGNDQMEGSARIIGGQNILHVQLLRADGVPAAPPRSIDSSVEPSGMAVSLAPTGSAETAYYPAPGPIQDFLQATTFNRAGTVLSRQRVAYDGGGSASNPLALALHGHPRVFWQKVRLRNARVEGAVYHSTSPPDLLTRLGLNIGTVWQNIGLVLFGSLAAGVLLALINVYVLLPLVPVWLLLRRMQATRRWPLFALATGVLLALLFALPASPPSFVLAIGTLGFPSAWLAVLGAALISFWSGRFVLYMQERSFRATACALIALTVVAAMYGVIFIEGQVGQI